MSLKYHFEDKLQNDELGWIPGFLRIHPIYDFRNFAENGQSDNGYFLDKFWKSYIGWIRENPEIHPSYNFRGFHSKMTIWAQKWKFWNLLELTLPISYITNKVHTFSWRVKLEFSNMECSKVLIVPTVNAIKALHAVGNIKLTSFRLESSIWSWKEWSWKSHQFTNFSMLPTLISNFMWEKS